MIESFYWFSWVLGTFDYCFLVGYTVAKDNVKLHATLNSWLDIQRSTGRIKKLYDYWIQGTRSIDKPQRWFNIDNLLKDTEK